MGAGGSRNIFKGKHPIHNFKQQRINIKENNILNKSDEICIKL